MANKDVTFVKIVIFNKLGLKQKQNRSHLW